jgi:hypothetical protein
METNLERIKRLEKENWELLRTLREICAINLFKLQDERRKAEAEGTALPEMPKWLDEGLELVSRLDK